jgi:hypothetical protein
MVRVNRPPEDTEQHDPGNWGQTHTVRIQISDPASSLVLAQSSKKPEKAGAHFDTVGKLKANTTIDKSFVINGRGGVI